MQTKQTIISIRNWALVSLNLACCVLLCNSCHEKSGPLADFYFPKEHAIYVYSSNDSIGREYWEVNRNGETYHTQVFDGAFSLTQETYENVYANGINLEKLNLIESGENISVSISSGFIFPFEEIDSSEVVFYKVQWKLPDENENMVKYELVRNRRFSGYEKRMVLGKEINCAVFKLDQQILTDLDGSIELNITGIEYYAQGIGLVYRQRRVTEEMVMEQELLQVLSSEDFIALKNATLKDD